MGWYPVAGVGVGGGRLTAQKFEFFDFERYSAQLSVLE